MIDKTARTKIVVTMTRTWIYEGEEAESLLDYATLLDSTEAAMKEDIISALCEDVPNILSGAEWKVTFEEPQP